MPRIRPFEPADLEACYAIAPYARLELAMVVEDGGGVAGFAVGTADAAPS